MNLRKILISLTLTLTFGSGSLIAQNQLELQFSPVDKGVGQLFIQLENKDNTYHLDTVMTCQDSKVILKVNDLASDSYLVRVFYDKNSNSKMDKNLLGVPTEAYGFSNNARGTFGPPSQSAMLFKVPGVSKMSIELK